MKKNYYFVNTRCPESETFSIVSWYIISINFQAQNTHKKDQINFCIEDKEDAPLSSVILAYGYFVQAWPTQMQKI